MPHLFAFRIISAPWMSHAILSKKKLVPPLDGMSDNDDKRDIYTDYSYWRIASSLVYYASRCSPLLTSSFAIINLQHLLTRLVIFSSLGCAKKRPFVKSFSLIERCHKWLGKLLNHRLFLSLERETSHRSSHDLSFALRSTIWNFARVSRFSRKTIRTISGGMIDRSIV